MQSGFGASFESEAIAGALPKDQNSPRHCPYGLYAEQVNGTPFTVRRNEASRCWLYRIRPAVLHGDFEPLEHATFNTELIGAEANPNLLRWRPLPFPSAEGVDFIDGVQTVGGNGGTDGGPGLAIHWFAANQNMTDRCFYDSDAELLIVPELGRLTLQTELGRLEVAPGHVAVIPRGIRFAVSLPDGPARGTLLEVFQRRLRLPDRGPIGANFLADERHFLSPTAAYEERTGVTYRVVAKSGGRLYETEQDHSPFDVVAWHGNHVPYQYDLRLFAPVGPVRIDHGDPSMYTVLTAALPGESLSVADFVIFPNRWDATQNTFRPPYFHRNAATEYNGCAYVGPADKADPKRGGPFLTPLLSAHGMSAKQVNSWLDKSDAEANEPGWISADLLSFQFESALPLRVTPWAIDSELRDRNYRKIHDGISARFSPPKG